MTDFRPAPRVVVGVDGSPAAVAAARWAVREAVSRDVPLRLVCVVDPGAVGAAAPGRRQFAAARAALVGAQHAVEAGSAAVKIDTDVVAGKPGAVLAEESSHAAMVCVGSIGARHACRSRGTVAATLPGLAGCPVAVIRRPQRGPAKARAVVADVDNEMDNEMVLRHAFEEARLRAAPLRALACWHAAPADDAAAVEGLANAQLRRRLTGWTRRYPDVRVEPVTVRGGPRRYLAEHAASVEVFVTGAGRGELGTEPADCSVLFVPGSRL